MPIAEIRIENYRAFKDTGPLRVGPTTAIVGQNDVGKSAILHGLQTFYSPPKKGGLQIPELHGKDPTARAVIEVAFRPEELRSQEVRIDAKNSSILSDDCLVDHNGLLRVRVTLSAAGIEAFDILVSDTADPELFPLGLKNQEQLLALLGARGLPAKRAGKETNQEKRNALRAHARNMGAGDQEEWVDARGIEKPLRAILPEFVFFEDTARYGVGETAVQNQFRGVVDRALAANPEAKHIEAEVANTIQAEFDKVYDRLQRLTSTVTGMRAIPSVSWKKAVEGISLTWTDAAGLELPYELRGAGVRRLFMVAYFQYEAAASLHDPQGSRYIFAVEEPELHLHPGAQRALERAFRDLGAMGHRVIFTTHSPVFAASTPLSDLVLVKRPDTATVAVQTPALDVHAVADELGVEASDRIVGKHRVVLVEGKADEGFFQTALEELHNAGHTGLDPNQVCFIQCGGVPNLKYAVTARRMDEVGVKWAVIVDSDRPSAGASIGRDAHEISASHPPTCLRVRVLERTAIENYMDATTIKAVTGMDCLVPHYGALTDPGGTPLKGRLAQIKGNAGQIARAMGAHGLIAHSQDSQGQSEWVQLFEDLRQAFAL